MIKLPIVPQRVAIRAATPFFAVAALLFTPAVALTSIPVLIPAASAAGCSDVEVIFVRGTDEAPGLGRVGNAFVGSLRQDTGRSISTYGVNYPANKDFLAAADGANDASNHIQQTINSCPGTQLVLGGYSQGAAVIDIVTAAPVPGLGFSAPLPPDAADHVAAVAVFGNPSARVGGSLSILSPQYGPKTLDLCENGDPVCSDGQNAGAHSGYVPGLTNQAASFAAGRL